MSDDNKKSDNNEKLRLPPGHEKCKCCRYVYAVRGGLREKIAFENYVQSLRGGY